MLCWVFPSFQKQELNKWWQGLGMQNLMTRRSGYDGLWRTSCLKLLLPGPAASVELVGTLSWIPDVCSTCKLKGERSPARKKDVVRWLDSSVTRGGNRGHRRIASHPIWYCIFQSINTYSIRALTKSEVKWRIKNGKRNPPTIIQYVRSIHSYSSHV
jgi:hypothetical protein